MIGPRGAEHLAEQIDRNIAIAARIPDAGPLRESLDRLQQWQRDRLDATYADLRAQERFRPACDFFLDDLYGGRDVHERDRQLGRMVPVMRRTLPDHLLHATGEAMRLQALSLELDFSLAGYLEGVEDIDQPEYAGAYRQQGEWDAREEQLRLIGELGRLLDETVRRPLVHGLVRMMRKPAELGGVGLLQAFLERGLEAFSRMDGAEEFLDTVILRETRGIEAIRAGHDWPYGKGSRDGRD